MLGRGAVLLSGRESSPSSWDSVLEKAEVRRVVSAWSDEFDVACVAEGGCGGRGRPAERGAGGKGLGAGDAVLRRLAGVDGGGGVDSYSSEGGGGCRLWGYGGRGEDIADELDVREESCGGGGGLADEGRLWG